MFYIFAPKLIKLGIGHKNSRQVMFTFSHKAERATCNTLASVWIANIRLSSRLSNKNVRKLIKFK